MLEEITRFIREESVSVIFLVITILTFLVFKYWFNWFRPGKAKTAK